MVDWDGLDIANEKAKMTGYQLADALRWLGQRAEAGTKRHRMSVSDKICTLWTSGQSGHRTRQSGRAHLEGIVQPVPIWKTDIKSMMMMTMMMTQSNSCVKWLCYKTRCVGYVTYSSLVLNAHAQRQQSSAIMPCQSTLSEFSPKYCSL